MNLSFIFQLFLVSRDMYGIRAILKKVENSMQYQVTLERRNFNRCLHLAISSVRLFNGSGSVDFMINVFSRRQSLQDLSDGVYDGALPAIDHLMVNGLFSAFRSQTYDDRLVLP